MLRLHRPALILSRSAAIGLTVFLSLAASSAVYAQAATDPGSLPGVSVSVSDAEHDAALVRMVRAMGIYPFAKKAWVVMFSAPGQENDPALDRFIDEVLPETWVCGAMADIFKPVTTGLSSKEIDDATRFFQSPVGKKYMQVVFRQIKDTKPVDLSAEKWSPAERSAITRFSTSPVGLASSKMISGDAAKALGEKLGAERMKDLLNSAQAKYAGLGDIDFQVEADRVHDGSSPAGAIEQLAVIKEFNDRSGRHQAESLGEIKPIIGHIANLQPRDVLAQQNFAQVRDEMQKADDTFMQAGQAVQKMVTYTTESMSVLTAPQGLKKIWMDAIDAKLGAANNTMTDLTATVHGLIGETRVLLDFLEAHKANITLSKEGKLVFANKDDLASFQGIATRLDTAREKLRNVAKPKSS